MPCEICGYAIVQKHRIKPGAWGGKYEEGNVVRLCPNHHSAIHLLMRWYMAPGKLKTQQEADRLEVGLTDEGLAKFWVARIKPVVVERLKKPKVDPKLFGLRAACLIGLVDMGSHAGNFRNDRLESYRSFGLIFEVPGVRPRIWGAEVRRYFHDHGRDEMQAFGEALNGRPFVPGEKHNFRNYLGYYLMARPTDGDWSRPSDLDVCNIRPLSASAAGFRPSYEPFSYTVQSDEPPPDESWFPLIGGERIRDICRDSREWNLAN